MEMAAKVDLAGLRQEFALLHKDLELLSTTMTVRLGSMLVVAPVGAPTGRAGRRELR